jgi:hypothetical protein
MIGRELARDRNKRFNRIQIEEYDHEQPTILGISVGDRFAVAAGNNSLHAVWPSRVSRRKQSV